MSNSVGSKFSVKTSTAVIVANMIGTGVFTSLGFQLLDINSGFLILLLWALGGLSAVCGAMCYAELGSALPRSGGEYNFLSRLLHPAAGFVSGWISLSIGFAAPVALSAITFASYLLPSLGIKYDLAISLVAAGLIVGMTVIHARSRTGSALTQQAFTAIKILLIVAFCIAALAFSPELQSVRFMPAKDDITTLGSTAFAVSLIYVSYAYTGWNAATYLSGEMENPQRNLPITLIAGTAIVTLLYIALNYVFLKVAPMAQMQGQIEIAYIAAVAAFGERGGQLTGVILALLLVSTVSAMTIAGPRVLQVIGQDFRAFTLFARENASGVPNIAVYFQGAMAVLFVVTSSFESILVFAGMTLALNSFITVATVFVLRRKQFVQTASYTMPLFPIPAVIYLTLTGWTIIFAAMSRPQEAAFSAALIVAGLLVYRFSAGLEVNSNGPRAD
ncbi:MAG: amino acid permease [Pseudomonadota bacterium]